MLMHALFYTSLRFVVSFCIVLLILAKAGVTGLAAIIGSRPFDVPSWLPAVLLLAATFVDYPPPLNKIAIKGEWNATHQKIKQSCSYCFCSLGQLLD
jgi:hypothetical protein